MVWLSAPDGNLLQIQVSDLSQCCVKLKFSGAAWPVRTETVKSTEVTTQTFFVFYKSYFKVLLLDSYLVAAAH